MPSASGTVYRYGTNQTIADASVKAVKESKVEHKTTDAYGDFTFEDLEAGKWSLVAVDETSLRGKPVQIDLVDNETGIIIELQRRQDDEDAKQGQRFFNGLLITLGVLVVVYLALHLIFSGPRAVISAALPALTSQAEERVAEAETISTDSQVDAAVTDVISGVQVLLEQSEDLNPADKEILRTTGAELEGAVAADDKQAALRRLGVLRRLVESSAPRGFTLWAVYPWSFVEVLLWGLAGVLVNKIFITSWYLRSQRFYREGIVMHIGHIVTTPLLVLIAVVLLSLVTFTFTLANSNEVTLDLSDPRILIAVSFLLGTSPWPLWNFVEDAGKRLTKGQA